MKKGGGGTDGPGDGERSERDRGGGTRKDAKRAVREHSGGNVDGEHKKDEDGTTISFEAMLTQAKFTDPPR